MESNRRKTNENASLLLAQELGNSTRVAQRNTLIFSSLCILVSTTKLKTSSVKLPFFDVSDLTDNYFVYGLTTFMFYTLVSFTCYAISDYLRIQHLKDKFNLSYAFLVSEGMSPPDPEQEHFDEEFESETGYNNFSMPIKLVRTLVAIKIFLLFIFPFCLGSYALLAISRYAYYL